LSGWSCIKGRLTSRRGLEACSHHSLGTQNRGPRKDFSQVQPRQRLHQHDRCIPYEGDRHAASTLRTPKGPQWCSVSRDQRQR
jgi:hypothetical protein